MEEQDKPGKNAIEHFCEMKVEIQDDHDQTVTITCGLIAVLQCDECGAWICGDVEMEHAIICIRCDRPFCREDWAAHKMSKDCEQRELA